MTHRVKVALSAAAIPIAVAAGISTIFYRPYETPTQRVYRLCRQCSDLERAEVDDLIDTWRSAPGTRADKLHLLLDLIDDSREAAYCAPCAEAILDAADRMNEP